MAAAARTPASDEPHVSVLIEPLIAAVAPVSGLWLDGTFGAGGYTRRLLEAGAERVIGLDRDPAALALAAPLLAQYGDRLTLFEGRFSELDKLAGEALDGVVLDLGVSSMQIDQAARGFSFLREGPLDMRMSGEGPTAADLVNTASEAELADILYHYGEERASRRIARSIVAVRPFETTLQLAEAVASCLPRPRPGQIHPATRAFQAIRIAVNDEFGELIAGLEAAERALKPGGKLAVVTFHSLEDRVVKRFLQARSGGTARANRYAPEAEEQTAQFTLLTRKAVGPSDDEVAANPRARSAKLRAAVRTQAPVTPLDRSALGLPGPRDWWKDTP
ncbi:16S rRNA (cytosine(1402)-N(4))-methyltransferase RsmH [Tropicimonas sp. IMCC6043]|uniref:16S rRNA (cytosine(1402)-N(4))-methyltransferase RsmH n=1 Tax=Tropicimonas sp. IMCC6043 TaxID=2510645 RepID=UPI00101CA2A7|nr:16S rRNA (cytosine(1402)-N(4))-methyltransferase RsmH [Tropicimonas sp. IMCC6043]RYH07651.1 16S rRNA (cytosine(1402)-N(4))-methyltransferase RsmH [Tropicimonas sp. IMCC6043]